GRLGHPRWRAFTWSRREREHVVPLVLSASHRPSSNCCKPLQNGNIVFPERGGLRRKHFQNPNDFFSPFDGACNDGTNTQCAAALAVNPRIVLCVVARDCGRATNTGTGKTRVAV